jgi:undecaprenyl-diphosphatase
METSSGLISDLITWLSLNPAWGGIAVFCIAGIESILVIGLFIPGTVVMIPIGSLIALGALDLFPTLFFAATGAITGDSISYWIGRYYRGHLREMWPFNRHQEWLNHAEKFFYRHGGKSIFLGRFIGPVRPFTPVVGGMLGLSPKKFIIVDTIAAAVWAPVYMLPGIILGTSLSLMAGVALRLTILALLVACILWVTYWLVKRIYYYLCPVINRLLIVILIVSRSSPTLNKITYGIRNPRHPRIRPLVELLLLFIFAAITYMILITWQTYASNTLFIDNEFYYLLQSLHTPTATNIMMFIAEISSPYLLQISSEINTIDIMITLNMIIYGTFAVLISNILPKFWQRLPYTFASLWIVAIIIANIYLGQLQLSNAIISLTLGIIWVALIGIISSYLLIVHKFDFKKYAVGLFTFIVILNTTYIYNNHQDNLHKYAVNNSYEYELAIKDWWESTWENLPEKHNSPNIEQTIQWAGDVKELESYLLTQGWQRPIPFWQGVFNWFSPEPKLYEIPIFPQLHKGRREVLNLIYTQDVDKQLVLRLWSSNIKLIDGPKITPLLVGNITSQYLTCPLGIINLPENNQAINVTKNSILLNSFNHTLITKDTLTHSKYEDINQNILLLRSKEAIISPISIIKIQE